MDAIDTLHELQGVQESISKSLSRLPDLERIISRIHAKTCRVKDFIHSLNAFRDIFVFLFWHEMTDLKAPLREQHNSLWKLQLNVLSFQIDSIIDHSTRLIKTLIFRDNSKLSDAIDELELWFDFADAATTGTFSILNKYSFIARKVSCEWRCRHRIWLLPSSNQRSWVKAWNLFDYSIKITRVIDW